MKVSVTKTYSSLAGNGSLCGGRGGGLGSDKLADTMCCWTDGLDPTKVCFIPSAKLLRSGARGERGINLRNKPTQLPQMHFYVCFDCLLTSFFRLTKDIKQKSSPPD